MKIEGYLFDIYTLEDLVYIWILDGNQVLHLVTDVYHPIIYADGGYTILHKLVDRLIDLDALYQEPRWVTKKHFYKNEDVKVLELIISRPSLLWKIKTKLFAMFRKLDIYHSDIEPVISYLYANDLYPISPVIVETEIKNKNNMITSIISTKPVTDFEYDIPPLRVMELRLMHSHRLGLSSKNPLLIEINNRKYKISESTPTSLIKHFNQILIQENPDVILSAFGDQIIFPTLFALAQKYNLRLELDRDNSSKITRKIKTIGTSFNTYGSWIYRAPSYPLFGRWHIDSANSFTYKETQMLGILELSRLSRLPVQRLARASTGSALTNMEMAVAIERGYLVPWQKSAVEKDKSWYEELLLYDKGGLVFMPDIEKSHIKENVVQLDFSQMYPSIMNLHNISPETVFCLCCTSEDVDETVPSLGYWICNKRRGIVSDTLGHVLDRRAFYKKQVKKEIGKKQTWVQAKIDSLKWINVVSFGYLGFRNAKFGKIESHESVTAFGRDKLLKAMHISENHGYELSHAITDSIFIHHPDYSSISYQSLQLLCDHIENVTKVEMSIEGVYTWLLFLPSRQDPKLPVSNKYLGRFDNGELKYRGIAVRRKDIPLFIRKAQLCLLEIMKSGVTIEDLRLLHDDMQTMYDKFDQIIESAMIPWRELLVRKTVSKNLEDYAVWNGTSLSMAELHKNKIHVQAGEKVKFVVLDQHNSSRQKRYIAEEMATLKYPNSLLKYDILFYRRMWWESYKEIWEYFAPEYHFDRMPEKQQYLFR